LLLDLLAQADPDPFRGKLRAALTKADKTELAKLATANEVRELSPVLVVQLAHALRRCGAGTEAIALLRQAQRNHPDDFWINHALAETLLNTSPPRAEEAIRYFTAAVALRPKLADLRVHLAEALQRSGKLKEAVESVREAIRLNPQLGGAFTRLGDLLLDLGDIDGAIAACADAKTLIALQWLALRLNTPLHGQGGPAAGAKPGG